MNFILFIGLLTAISQNYARKLSVSIDSLEFQFLIQDYIVETDADILGLQEIDTINNDDKKDGILIYGMYMDGVKWDYARKCIVDSEKRFNVAPHFLCRILKVTN